MNPENYSIGTVGQEPPRRRDTRYDNVAAMKYAGHTVDLTPEELKIVGPMNRKQRRKWLRANR